MVYPRRLWKSRALWQIQINSAQIVIVDKFFSHQDEEWKNSVVVRDQRSVPRLLLRCGGG